MSLFAMISLGFGEIIGSLLMGKISDKWGYHTSLKILLGLTLVAFTLLFGIIAMNAFNLLTFVMTFVWGL
jgi:predicted MFS family arabinose efflux permease